MEWNLFCGFMYVCNMYNVFVRLKIELIKLEMNLKGSLIDIKFSDSF